MESEPTSKQIFNGILLRNALTPTLSRRERGLLDYLPEGEGTSGICFKHFNRVGEILPAVPVGLVMRLGKDLIN
jgi:hypothetical protein